MSRRPFFVRHIPLVLLALTGVASNGLAQPPLRDLPRPSLEIEDPFAFVAAALEIRGGRLIVADGLEAQLFVVDFAQGTRQPLGRQGSGPGEYRMPAGLFRINGDTIWVLDAAQMRIVVFNPDLTAGTGFPFLMFDQQTSSAYSAPFFADNRGRMYASVMTIQASRTGGGAAMQFPDSVSVVRVDARERKGRAEITRVRFRVSGKPEMQRTGNDIKYKVAFPGLVASDAWAVFPDGRTAVVRGDSYSVEFIALDGKREPSKRIHYERFKVTDEDKKTEMEQARREVLEQQKAMRKFMPANLNMTLDLTAPDKWPNEYPAIAGIAGLPAPDGSLWLKRAIPVRHGREQWDVIDRTGKLVARWQLPPKVTLVALGSGVAYTVRSDEDDLRYVQRVPLPN